MAAMRRVTGLALMAGRCSLSRPIAIRTHVAMELSFSSSPTGSVHFRGKKTKAKKEKDIPAKAANQDDSGEEFDVNVLREDMADRVSGFQKHLLTLRMGRATPDILDSVFVPYHGQSTQLRALASVRVSDAQSLVVSPFESPLAEVMQIAITNSELGIGCSIDSNGRLIVKVPKATRESREAMAKDVGKMAEQTKVRVRDIRHKGLDELKRLSKDLSKDRVFQLKQELQDVTDACIAEITKIASAKEKEVLGQ